MSCVNHASVIFRGSVWLIEQLPCLVEQFPGCDADQTGPNAGSERRPARMV